MCWVFLAVETMPDVPDRAMAARIKATRSIRNLASRDESAAETDAVIDDDSTEPLLTLNGESEVDANELGFIGESELVVPSEAESGVMADACACVDVLSSSPIAATVVIDSTVSPSAPRLASPSVAPSVRPSAAGLAR